MRSRKEKRPHHDSAPEQRARVIKSGIYDGSRSSRDFVVSGHSTGSANTEMEALSHQVSIDAGRVPDYSDSDSVPDQKYQGSGASAEADSRFTGSGSVEGSVSSKTSIRTIALGGTIGAAVGALGYLAYRYYEGYQMKKSAEPVFE